MTSRWQPEISILLSHRNSSAAKDGQENVQIFLWHDMVFFMSSLFWICFHINCSKSLPLELLVLFGSNSEHWKPNKLVAVKVLWIITMTGKLALNFFPFQFIFTSSNSSLKKSLKGLIGILKHCDHMLTDTSKAHNSVSLRISLHNFSFIFWSTTWSTSLETYWVAILCFFFFKIILK